MVGNDGAERTGTRVGPGVDGWYARVRGREAGGAGGPKKEKDAEFGVWCFAGKGCRRRRSTVASVPNAAKAQRTRQLTTPPAFCPPPPLSCSSISPDGWGLAWERCVRYAVQGLASLPALSDVCSAIRSRGKLRVSPFAHLLGLSGCSLWLLPRQGTRGSRAKQRCTADKGNPGLQLLTKISIQPAAVVS